MSKWVSVEKRLPADSRDVLVAVVEPNDDPYIEVAAYREQEWSDVWGTFAAGAVTHWMPLPPMPEEIL